MKKKLSAAAAVATAAVAVTGLLASAGAAAQGQAVRVAVVTDIGGLNDKGFNSLSYAGLQRAKRELGVEGRAFITRTAADRIPNLTAAAQQGYNLIIGVGFLMFDPLGKVAPQFKDIKFAGVDVPYGFTVQQAGVQSIPNLRGLLFREAEAGCLVGNVAALEARRLPGPDIISAVGANRVPAIVAFIAGYQYCAKRANKDVRVLVNYANDPTFANQAKCRATALSQIARGSKIVFQVAGQCGLGALDAAKARGVWGIGVDADQYFLGPHVLTSATKKVDVAVYDTIADFKRTGDRFRGGFDKIFTVKNKGVGYGRLSTKLPAAVRAEYKRSTDALARLIASGKVKPPSQ
ncbi:MAG TPA: BMP family ABC transporter substrate-binding protein [Gaiellaceae bacterium]|nr:BMP family ABC transporter substrate-binding protein [Gaiellaceae bacterium]